MILFFFARSLERFGMILQDHEIVPKIFYIYMYMYMYHDLENCLHTLLKIPGVSNKVYRVNQA